VEISPEEVNGIPESGVAESDLNDECEPPEEPMDELFETALAEKDDLIAALTAQLEETVEQLDRLHRQGVERGGRSSGGSVPAEFIDDQRNTSDRLNQWLDLWDQTSPIDQWARIEQRLEDMAMQMAGRSFASPAPVTGFDAPAAAPAFAPQGDGASMSAWEETKMRLLGELGGMPAAPQPTIIPSAQPSHDAAAAPSPAAEQVEYPAAIDMDAADRNQLCEAIEIRDRYISYLTHRLRGAEMLQPLDWTALNEAPSDLRSQLQELETRYREHLRREECDLALERARLAREQQKLKQDRGKFEQQMRQSGLHTEQSPAAGEDKDERNWLKRLGRKG
jgi:hypothetical protein